jgi:hypothetical protein
MPTLAKTSTQTFIETAAGFWSRFAPWISECETYTVDHDNGRHCPPCAEAKVSYEQSEVE